jgi:hypothetical protein
MLLAYRSCEPPKVAERIARGIIDRVVKASGSKPSGGFIALGGNEEGRAEGHHDNASSASG